MKRDAINLYDRYGVYIDRSWKPAVSGKTKEIFNPANGEPIGSIPVVGQEDIAHAIRSAKTGFATWRQIAPWKRAEILREAARLIRERSPAIAAMMSTETGKPIAQAAGEISDAADQFDWYAGETQRIYGQTIEARLPDVRSYVRYDPVGVVAAFSAWNFPALLPSRKIAAALAAGCAVIVKPASEAAGSAMAIVQALHDANLPEGAVSLLTGESSTISEALLRSSVVAKISFTGSTDVGKKLLKLAAEGVKRISMELGGHAPVLIFEDADPEYAGEMCARFKFRNCGQVCASPSRFYVHESIYEAFCRQFAKTASSLKVGPGLDPDTQVGPMANARGLAHAQHLIADAVNQGATLLCGGKRPDYIPGDKGFYIEPTVLSNVPDSAAITQLEPFAPVAPITAFKTFDEAIEKANSTPYGLASYVFTRSLKTATLASEQIEAGMVGVNDMAIAAAEMPFGGVKESGMGREGGAFGIHEYLEPKYVRLKLM